MLRDMTFHCGLLRGTTAPVRPGPAGSASPPAGHSADRPADRAADRPGDRPGDRIGDRERDAAAELLGVAAAEGLVDLAELDARLGAVFAARTRGDVDRVTADLPVGWRRGQELRAAADRAHDLARAGLRGHVAAYVGVMVLLVAIWLTVGLTAQSWYPWPVWPALGWGIGLAGHLRAARA